MILIRSPDRATLPSRTLATLSNRPTSRISTLLPLNGNAEDRAITRKSLMRARESVISSVKPSEKYWLAGSGVKFTKGRTATEGGDGREKKPRHARTDRKSTRLNSSHL